MNEIKTENGSFGLKLVIKGVWKDEYLTHILENNIYELELNDGKGWMGDNVDFLKFLPHLKSLIIIDFKIKSLDAIHHLHNLEHLHLLTYSKKAIDFNVFPHLIKCGFEWIKGSDSLFHCSNLKTLGINRYDYTTSKDFSKLNSLEKLTIMNSKIEDLNGISNLKKLSYLSISNLKKLSTLQGIQNLSNLKELEIQRCKGISEIEELSKLQDLRRLLLIDLGNISSIKSIEQLNHLNEFLFYESTNITDGDLSPIESLKNLHKISFQNRKHYSHKREDFPNLYN